MWFSQHFGSQSSFFLKGAERPSNEIEVVSPDDAAVTESAGLTARHELHQPGGVSTWAMGWDIDRESDDLLTTDNVAIAGGDIPHTPWDALMWCREPLSHQAELGQGKLLQLIHSCHICDKCDGYCWVFFASEFTLCVAKISIGASHVKDKVVIAYTIMSARGKKKSTAPPKATTRRWRCRVDANSGKASGISYWIPIECSCKGTHFPRYHQRCALFNWRWGFLNCRWSV